MPISKPSLDGRTFDELLTDSRARIPRLAPPWTDHNASDPGITLVELLSWLVEQDLFRLDRLPEAEIRAFLRLVRSEPRPATVAWTVVTFGWSGAAPAPMLPTGLQLGPDPGHATFETTRAVVLSPASLVQVLQLGPDPEPGDALYLGFDQPLGPPGTRVRLAVLGPDPAADAATWAAVIAEWAAATRDDLRCCPAGAGRGPSLRDHQDVSLVWEHHRADGSWATLPRVQDSTRALTLSGWVTFRVPADHAPGGPGPHHYIRARLDRGRYGTPPAPRTVLLNAVPAAHAVRVDPPEDGGLSEGHAHERFDLGQVPIVAGSVSVTFTHPVVGVGSWREVHDWLDSGPHDADALVEPAVGRVTFGNGLRGRVPRAGARLSVGYQVGSGPGGNVPAGSLTSVPLTPRNVALIPGPAAQLADLRVQHVLGGFGGRVAESVDDATARVIDRIQAADKAVTLADFERLALTTPAAGVARARAVAAYDDLLPCVPAAGLVTVVVVPDATGPTPTPTAGVLGSVLRYLERRRLVTTQVKVMAACYDEISVSGTLVATEDADAGVLVEAAELAVDAYLHPLHGGRDGRGYPIGRPVYLVDVMTLLTSLPEVSAVTDFGLAFAGDEPGCANLPLCPQCLPAPGKHQFTVAAGRAVRVPDRRTADVCR
ncbi:MAG TPA: baseplate J/gp47 family protein [Actinomycetes bacterium]